MQSVDVWFLKGYGMIRSHIGSTQECGVILKLERFSNLSNRFFGLDSPIGLRYVSKLSPLFNIRVPDGIVRPNILKLRIGSNIIYNDLHPTK